MNKDTHKALRSLVSEFIGALPDPDNPQPPGPWDPVIRRAVTRFNHQMGPFPEPWRAGGPLPDPWLAGLNPQPLPPRMRFAVMLAEEVIDHVSRLQDIAEVTGKQAPAYLSRFVDDIELCPPWWKWPPFPPKRGQETLLDPIDLGRKLINGVL